MNETIRFVSPNFSDLFVPNVEIGKFPDGDTHVKIPSLASCEGKEVVVFHRLYPNQNEGLIELLLMMDAIHYQGATKITVVSPYLPYARQDKQTVGGEIASAHVICNILARAGCDRFVTFDCHFLNAEGNFKHGDLNITNISMSKPLIDHARKLFEGQSFEIVGPDDGAAYLVKDSGGTNLKKVRKNYDAEKIAYRHIDTMEGNFDVEGKNVLLLDDMISTGNTMIKALEKMMDGGAKKVICAATHGLFLYNCLDRLSKRSSHVFAADSILSAQSLVSIKPALDELFDPQNKLF